MSTQLHLAGPGWIPCLGKKCPWTNDGCFSWSCWGKCIQSSKYVHKLICSQFFSYAIKLWTLCTALVWHWSCPLPACCHLSNMCCVARRATRHGFALCDWSVIFLPVLADGYSVQCVWKQCTQTNSLCASECWKRELVLRGRFIFMKVNDSMKKCVFPLYDNHILRNKTC